MKTGGSIIVQNVLGDPLSANELQARRAAFEDAVQIAARRLNATPIQTACGFALYSLPGYPELTASQLLDIAGRS